MVSARSERWLLVVLLSLTMRLGCAAEEPDARRTLGASHFDCEVGYSNWQESWTAAKKAWCCTSTSRGCPSAARAVAPAANASVPTLVVQREWDRRLASQCDLMCGYGGRDFTCAERIRYTAAHSFQDQAGSCESAFGVVLSQCPSCAPCPLSEAACSSPLSSVPAPPPAPLPPPPPPPPPPPTPFPYPPPAPAPATPNPAACANVCSYQGKSASCSFRIQWGAHHRYLYEDQACKKAWIMVATECSECTLCPLDQAGCVEQPAPPTETTQPPKPFDCLPDVTNRVAGWSDEKRHWCCINRGHGCPAGNDLGARSVPFDCLAGYKNWKHGWSEKKQEWCCKHRDRGCEKDTDADSGSDSGSDSDSDSGKTSSEKTSDSEVVGDDDELFDDMGTESGMLAPPAPSPFPMKYDCLAGLAGWERLWSDQKKKWCCKRTGKGCLDTDREDDEKEDEVDEGKTKEKEDSFGCSQEEEDWEAIWSKDEKAWCCEHRKLGCPDTTTHPTTLPYDCLAGFAKWEEVWSEEKIHWCCRHRGKGCPPASTSTTTPKSFDCKAGSAKWKSGWSGAKKEWCCKHEQVHCPPSKFNCHEDLSEWRERWSPAKKEWCCQNEEVHCNDDPYDCNGGFPEAWAHEQRDWCCKHEHKGCSGGSDPEDKYETARGSPLSGDLRARAWTWIVLPSLCAALVGGLAATLIRPLRSYIGLRSTQGARNERRAKVMDARGFRPLRVTCRL